MVKDLHPYLAGLPIPAQEAIVSYAMGHYTSDWENEDIIASFIKWRDCQEDIPLSELGILPWEHFEDYSQPALYELVTEMLHGLKILITELSLIKEQVS